jgi:hypothetical protein
VNDIGIAWLRGVPPGLPASQGSSGGRKATLDLVDLVTPRIVAESQYIHGLNLAELDTRLRRHHWNVAIPSTSGDTPQPEGRYVS